MDNLAYKLQNAQQAKKSLDKAIELFFEEIDNFTLFKIAPEAKEAIRDGLIQRFEFVVEATWKLAQAFIKEIHGVNCEASPKKIFRECLSLGILNENEVELSIKMIDDRNLTSHTYKEEIAKQVVNKIPGYAKLIAKILKHIGKEIKV